MLTLIYIYLFILFYSPILGIYMYSTISSTVAETGLVYTYTRVYSTLRYVFIYSLVALPPMTNTVQ